MEERKNYIIAEFEIKKEDINKDIKVINSFNEYNKENNTINIIICEKDLDDNKFKNEIKNENKEEKDICKFYRFGKEGKFKIIYLFKNNLIDTSNMFSDCKSSTNIDLSNFKTEKLNNIRNMFNGCESLISLNLDNFSIQNVTKMDYLFYGFK